MNFITGSNGSGKSSILLAIRLALGMKVSKAAGRMDGPGGGGAGGKRSAKSVAAGTHAAITISDVIRSGSDGEAIAEITMQNEGLGCLDPTIWGSAFILRRTLTALGGRRTDKLEAFRCERDGRAGAKVMPLDAEGRPIPLPPAKHGEWIVRQLAEGLNVFYSNPVMVMDQDASKSFFTGSARHKYRFFLEALGLKVRVCAARAACKFVCEGLCVLACECVR
jgi:energy-coupling factor transporter ATP-binding protein EcfA2